MEKEYKLGLIGAIIFTIFAFIFYLVLKRGLIESEILALLFSLIIVVIVSKRMR
jgi:hypothetical protein